MNDQFGKFIRIAGAVAVVFLAAAIFLEAPPKSEDTAMNGTESIEIYNATTGKIEKLEPVRKTDQEWRQSLTPEQYKVLRTKGTEPAFSQICPIPKGGKGIYQCAGCGTDLFAYEKKFDSGTGWPSFWHPVSDLNVRTHEDKSFGMRRTEVLCARCGGHLGHVFDDGPPPTHKRYCINTVSLKLKEIPAAKGDLEKNK